MEAKKPFDLSALQAGAKVRIASPCNSPTRTKTKPPTPAHKPHTHHSP